MLGFSKKGDSKAASSGGNTGLKGAAMEGILKRKNRHGEWKERYCKFTSTQFVAYKTSKGKATTEMKECYNLKEIVTAELNAKGQLLVTLLNGDQSLFKGDNIPAWKDAILSLSEEANEIHQETIAQAAGSSNAVSISGYLMKQSHNKYQGYQERYMRLEGTQLKYYKKEGEQEQGAINIVSADFIRPFSDDDTCKIFEIADQDDRVYAFQARSHTEMVRWIQTLNTVRNAAMEKAEEEKAAKLEAETPERIRFFDNEGEDAFKEIYREQLMDMYPDPAKEVMTIKTHLQYATEVVQYLKDLIPELQAVGNRPARYDILAVAMTETNAILSNRINFFVEPTFDDGTGDAGNQYLHDVLETANLGELHALIHWLSKYQSTLRGIRCPVHSPGTPAVTSQARLSTTHLNPKQCDVFQYLQRICELYVYGGSSGAKGGAAEHLADHCHKVWQSVESNPEEMLQRHNNGTFFTEAPIQMWMAINQHIALATSTNSPILHVMIAEKVVTSLIGIFEHIIQYIQTLDTSQRPSLREVELEYVSALANDTALHIEDVIELIENFTIPEIREKIDEIFDPLTTTLFQCGQTCLKRLAKLVMADVQSLLDQVFEEEWMEGSQMRVATATISDYMRDFQEFLVPFWADKFVMTILEEVIVSYTRTLLFRKDKKKSVTTTVTTTDPGGAAAGAAGSVGGMFSSFFQKTKQTITQTITTQVPTHVPVDAESLGRLAQDVNILNAFFSQKAGQELATEFLQLINEVSLLLFVDVPSIIQHIAVRVSEYPAAAQAIHDVAIAVMKLRYDDFTRADMDYVSQQVQSVLQSAPEDAARQEAEGIIEGRLGLLYNDVVPKDPSATLAKGGAGAMTLTQRMRVMANIPLFGAAARTIIGDEDDDGDGAGAGGGEDDNGNGRAAATSVNTPSGAGDRLLKDVLDVLNEQEPDSLEQDNEYAREQARIEAEEAARKAKLLYYDGYLEKKSPAHNLWQRRFYKLVTREVDSLDKPFVYSLLWFKKEGGSLIKSLEVDKIASMAILQTARAMAFVLPPKGQVMLMSEATASGWAKCAIPVVECDHEENKNDAKGAPSVVKQEYYTMLITQADGKEHVLRGLKVDRVMKWINTLAQAGGFAYDSVSRTWTRAAFENFKRLEAEGRLPVPEPPPSLTIAHSPAAAGRNRTMSSSSMVDDTRHSSASASSTSAANTPTSAAATAALTLPSTVNPKSAASAGGSGGSGGGGGSGVSQRQVLQSLQEHDDDAGAAPAATRGGGGGARDRLRSRSSVGDSHHSGAPSRSTTQDEYDDTSATTPRDRDSSHDEIVAVATKLRRQSQQLGVHSLPEERLAQLAVQQTQDDSTAATSVPPPPAASSSPRSPPPRKTSTSTAPLTPRDDDGGVLLHDDTTATTRTSLSSAGGSGANRSRLNSETTNPIFAQPSPTAASVKRASVSTENPLAQSSPLQTRPSLSSASKSVRKTAPPPPPPPPADASPPPPAPPAPPAGDDADDRDSLFYDRETQAWPSSANTSFALDSQSNDADASSGSGGSPRAGGGGGKSATTHRASVAKRAAQNRARQQQQQQQQQQQAAAQPSQPSQPAAVAPVSIAAAASGSSSSGKATTASSAKQTTTAAVDRDDDFDRSSVMTVDLDAGPAPKATVAGGGGGSRNMQAFEVQEQSNAKHNDSERLLGDQKKPAGCPCVIS